MWPADFFKNDKKLFQRIVMPFPLADYMLKGPKPGTKHFGADAIGCSQFFMGTGFYNYLSSIV
jgi:hypothetical protein